MIAYIFVIIFSVISIKPLEYHIIKLTFVQNNNTARYF